MIHKTVFEEIQTRVGIIQDQCDKINELLQDSDVTKDILKELVDIKVLVDYILKEKEKSK